MLNTARSRIRHTAIVPLLPNLASFERGVGIVETQNGFASFDGTLAGAGFLGVANAWLINPSRGVMVERVTVPAGGGKVTLKRKTPTGTTLLTKAAPGTTGYTTVAAIDGTGTSDPTTGAAETKAYTPVGTNNTIVEFGSNFGGFVIDVVYTYDLTVAEARALVGDVIVGQTAVDALQNLSVITAGEVYTDQFDAGNDWAVEDIVRVSATGKFVGGATGVAIRGHVIAPPSLENPFLGLRLIG